MTHSLDRTSPNLCDFMGGCRPFRVFFEGHAARSMRPLRRGRCRTSSSATHRCMLFLLWGIALILQASGEVAGNVTTIAGSLSGTIGQSNSGSSDGRGTAASFNYPAGIAMDAAGSFVLIVSYGKKSYGERSYEKSGGGRGGGGGGEVAGVDQCVLRSG